jgi:type 1 glutamine amidotransferase
MAATKARILVYSGSTGFRHDSIPAAVEALKAIGTKAGYTVDATEDPEVFSADKLKQYRALVLVSTSTDPKKPESEWFTGAKRDALQGFLKDGKGVVGLHAAADSHYNWGWYGQMIGGYFERQRHAQGHRDGDRCEESGDRQTTQDARTQRRMVLLQGLRSDGARAHHHRPRVDR